MNVEIIDTIQTDTKEPFVKESIEPSVIYKGHILHKARIIKAIGKESSSQTTSIIDIFKKDKK